jgi:hypothetical protein
VLDSESSAKYGSAHLGIVLASEGWSSALKQQYISTLTSRKWIKLPGDKIQFCKDSVLVTLQVHAGMIQKQGVHALNFVFDGGTKKECVSAIASQRKLVPSEAF